MFSYIGLLSGLIAISMWDLQYIYHKYFCTMYFIGTFHIEVPWCIVIYKDPAWSTLKMFGLQHTLHRHYWHCI